MATPGYVLVPHSHPLAAHDIRFWEADTNDVVPHDITYERLGQRLHDIIPYYERLYMAFNDILIQILTRILGD